MISCWKKVLGLSFNIRYFFSWVLIMKYSKHKEQRISSWICIKVITQHVLLWDPFKFFHRDVHQGGDIHIFGRSSSPGGPSFLWVVFFVLWGGSSPYWCCSNFIFTTLAKELKYMKIQIYNNINTCISFFIHVKYRPKGNQSK